MTIPRDITRKYPALNEWAIAIVYRGSIAHNLYVPSDNPNSVDDKDILAVCVPPLEYYFGLKEYGTRGTKEIKQDEWDIVTYEARKFISMLMQGNPNVLSTLWLRQNMYLKITDGFRLLLDNRQAFVGKHVYHSFTGYAHSQMHRMTHMAHAGYMGQKRKTLVDKYGYDTKNAAHLIRLLRMGIEFLTDGELHVFREDAKQLLEIKNGEWTLEQVQTEADRGFKLAEEAFVRSTLPAGPDKEQIKKLVVEIVQSTLKDRGEI